MKLSALLVGLSAIAAVVLVIAVPDWHGPVRGTQMGFRASSMVQFDGPAARRPINTTIPATLPAAEAGGPTAGHSFKNVQVLPDVGQAEFMRLQTAMTEWVAPKQGCGFCHDTGDYSSDAKPTKLAARRMLEMTRYVNSAWQGHVGPSGVTCYTCHRGEPVPKEVWWPRKQKPERAFISRSESWNESADTVSSFFPNAGYAEYFLQDNPISVQSPTAERSHSVAEAVVVKRVYEMMMQMSLQIGVNCGFCHNSRALQDWSQSTPERWVGYYALRMIRDLNRTFLLPLAALIPQQRALVDPTALPVIPENEAGWQPGNALLTCATCHYGMPRPLGGAHLLKDYAELAGSAPASPESDQTVMAGLKTYLQTIQRPQTPNRDRSGAAR